jgi:hypothetical protein
MELARSLILDLTLYPRSAVDPFRVSRYMHALQAGAVFPPPIVDRETRRVVDGFHRITANLRVHGEDAQMEVEWRDYDSEADLWLDSVTLNASHGLAFSAVDQTRILVRSTELGIDPVRIAGELSITPQRAAGMVLTRTAVGPDATVQPLKPIARHLAGTTLTEAQAQANRRAGGNTLWFYAEQVTAAIEAGMVPEDMRTIAALGRLAEAVAAYAPQLA